MGATYMGKQMSFTYDDNGIRQSKMVNGTTTNYYWSGSMLIAEETEGVCTVYLYDDTGAPIGFQYRTPGYAEDVWDTYLYEKNLQGDIIAVYNLAGEKLVSYTYDAWGNFTTTYHNGGRYTPAASNPYTYRGYYYDTDLGLYYLMSRYYDSNIGRFISPDTSAVITATPTALTDKNLYAYCDNNPVMRVDNSGEFWLTTIGIMAVGGLIGAAISAATSAITQQALTGTVNWKSVVVASASGFVSGAIAASPLSIVGQQIAGGVVGGLSYMADCYVNDRAMKLDEAILSVGVGVISGRIGGSGANEKMVLTNSIKSTKQIIAREARRANQQYAKKAIAKAINYGNNTLAKAAWVSSFRFAAGLGVSNGATVSYSSWELFPNAPTWKPW